MGNFPYSFATRVSPDAAVNRALAANFAKAVTQDDLNTAIAGVSGVGGPPTGAAGGVLGGTYPNPSFAVDMATQAELDAEATTRGTADTTLQSNITSEASTRANADTAETAARSLADVVLQQGIDDLSSEFSGHHHDERYYTQAAMTTLLSAYLTTSSAAATYLTIASAASTYATLTVTDTEAATRALAVVNLRQDLDDVQADFEVHHHDTRYLSPGKYKAGWSALTQYSIGDLVVYSGHTLMATDTPVLGATPYGSNAGVWDYDTWNGLTGWGGYNGWSYFAARGATGPAAAASSVTVVPAGNTVSVTNVQADLVRLEQADDDLAAEFEVHHHDDRYLVSDTWRTVLMVASIFNAGMVAATYFPFDNDELPIVSGAGGAQGVPMWKYTAAKYPSIGRKQPYFRVVFTGLTTAAQAATFTGGLHGISAVGGTTSMTITSAGAVSGSTTAATALSTGVAGFEGVSSPFAASALVDGNSYLLGIVSSAAISASSVVSLTARIEMQYA